MKPLEDDPLWYKDAVFYELHVRAFCDSDGDGIGDFKGLAGKLDYLQDLGVNTLWLLPFYPSPLRDDGYDIADYTGVHPSYGTLADFKAFLKEAHRRGLRVVTEMVLNHTSEAHPWFQKARRSPAGSSARDFYVWSDSTERFNEARVIFKDFEASNWTWDPVAKAYYWHRFYAHQPDLNYDNPKVKKAVLEALDFWLEMGVDGMRLDAVPYLFEREHTSCENLPETHAFLQELRRHVDGKYRNRMLLAEANQWPEDAAAYFGSGDECHMAFHFPIMPRLFMAIHQEDRFPIVDIMGQTPPLPATCQWALFLRNHDELTLEMVTDEERDYMVRVYANDPQSRINLGIRRRLAPLLGNNRRKFELMNGLLFSLPGTPVIYYGDEIGMGDNIYLGDRNGVRTPMQWGADRNAGFSKANPQRLYLPVVIDPEYHYQTANVEAQQNNPHSLLWWMKRVIALSRGFKAFGRGSIEFLLPRNPKVLAYVRRHEEECLLVVANLSRFVQYVELDLSAFKGRIPVELFGKTEFPPVREESYLLTLGPHAFYWFLLQPAPVEAAEAAALDRALPSLRLEGDWTGVFQGKAKAALEKALPEHLRHRRWFAGKARRIKAAEIREIMPLDGASSGVLALVRVDYREGDPETYLLPLAFSAGERAREIAEKVPQALVARLGEGVLHDALEDPGFCAGLLEAVRGKRRLRGPGGELRGLATGGPRGAAAPETGLEPSVLRAQQSNTSVVYGGRLILKVFRKLDNGVNPDVELGRFLTLKTSFKRTPALQGLLEYRSDRGELFTLGNLQEFVPNQGDAWSYTVDEIARFLERGLADPARVSDLTAAPAGLAASLACEPPALAREMIGAYLESARLLGATTAELHLALASMPGDPDFAPEPFTPLYQRSVYQSMRSLAGRAFPLLRERLEALPAEVRSQAQRVLGLEGEALKVFRSFMERRLSAVRIRCHGDYHLGQLLYTGKDFLVTDFEGEPARPLGERRLKRSPLRDVAGMLRSFEYAVSAALARQTGEIPPERRAEQEAWAAYWAAWVGRAFLKSYFETAGQASFLPRQAEEIELMLRCFLLEKAVYELGYELNNRPDWTGIPLRGILGQLERAS